MQIYNVFNQQTSFLFQKTCQCTTVLPGSYKQQSIQSELSSAKLMSVRCSSEVVCDVVWTIQNPLAFFWAYGCSSQDKTPR